MNDKLPDIVYAGAALCSAAAAVLAWIAKLKWSKEFGAAKDATIQAKETEIKTKEAHIESLKSELENVRSLTPMKIREYFESVTSQMEEYNNSLQGQIAEAHAEIECKTKEIGSLQSQGTEQSTRIQELEDEKKRIQQTADALSSQVAELKTQPAFSWKMPTLDPHVFLEISDSSRKLRDALSHGMVDYSTRIEQLSSSLQDSAAFFRTGFQTAPGGNFIIYSPKKTDDPEDDRKKTKDS